MSARLFARSLVGALGRCGPGSEDNRLSAIRAINAVSFGGRLIGALARKDNDRHAVEISQTAVSLPGTSLKPRRHRVSGRFLVRSLEILKAGANLALMLLVPLASVAGIVVVVVLAHERLLNVISATLLAVAIFVLSMIISIAFLVSFASRREGRRARLSREVPDSVTNAARFLTGLYVRTPGDQERKGGSDSPDAPEAEGTSGSSGKLGAS